jgi:crossover junction endodeoxyribonuclease RuvC
MRKIGIDPGVSGAIVVLYNGHPAESYRMPVMKIGSTSRVNASALAAMIRPYSSSLVPTEVYVEQVGAMPGQGVSSMFSFGHSCGVIAGVLGAFEMRVELVTPQVWKKRAGLIGSDKDASRSRAIQMWPEWRELDKKGAGQALADAALIAYYGVE